MDLFNIIKLYQDDIDKAKWERTVIDASQNVRIHKKTFVGSYNRDIIRNIKNIVETFNGDGATRDSGQTLDNLIIHYTIENNVSGDNLTGNIIDTDKPEHLQNLLTRKINTSEFSRERKRKNARSVKEEDPELWQQLIDELKIEVEFEKQFKSDLRNSDSLKEFLKLYPNMPGAKQLYQKEQKNKPPHQKKDSPVRRRIEINPDTEKGSVITLHLANSKTGAEVRNIKIIIPSYSRRLYASDVTISLLCSRQLVDGRDLTEPRFRSHYVDNASKWLYSIIYQIYRNNIETLNLGEGLGDS